MDLLEEHKQAMLTLEINSLKSQIEIKDKLIEDLVQRLDTTKPILNKTPPPLASSLAPSHSRSSLLPQSPPPQPIASGSGSNSNSNSISNPTSENGETAEDKDKARANKLALKKRMHDHEIEILKWDEIRAGKRVKPEPEEAEVEAANLLAAEVPIIPAVIIPVPILPPPPPPAPLPMEKPNSRVYSVRIEPIRIASTNPENRGEKGNVSKGFEHHLSIGESRITDGNQCLTVERIKVEPTNGNLEVREVILEFEASAIHSVAHRTGDGLYMFSFNANAHQVWKSLSEATNCEIPPLNSATPSTSFIIPDINDLEIMEEMIQPFVESNDYASYVELDNWILHTKEYIGGCLQHGITENQAVS